MRKNLQNKNKRRKRIEKKELEKGNVWHERREWKIMKRPFAMSWEPTQGGNFFFLNYLIIGCALNDDMPL